MQSNMMWNAPPGIVPPPLTEFELDMFTVLGHLNRMKQIREMSNTVNVILSEFFTKSTYVHRNDANGNMLIYFHPRRGYRLKRRLGEILREPPTESWLLGTAEHSLKTILDFCYDFWKERDESCIIKKPTIEDIHEYAIKYNRVFQETESDDWN